MAGQIQTSWVDQIQEQLSKFLHSPIVIALVFAFFVKNLLTLINPLPPEPVNSRVKKIDSQTSWNEAVLAAKEEKALVMVDFFATWCGPCKGAAPTFSALSTRYTNVHFLKVDVDKAYSVSKSMGVSAMPTFILCNHEGKAVERVQGFSKDTPSQLIAILEKHLKGNETTVVKDKKND